MSNPGLRTPVNIGILNPNMDCRLPENREETFMKFYEYHLKLRAHPGCVYFIFPYLFKRFNFTMEQKLWFCYLNGVTQNPMTTWRIYKEFPDFEKLDIDELEKWHLSEHKSGVPMWKTLSYDVDRRYQKGHLVKMVKNYQGLISSMGLLGFDNQEQFFYKIAPVGLDPMDNFENLWKIVKNDFFMFGRLSTFSYLEYLKIAGINIDCPSLFLEDLGGSLSHRNGILKVYGYDALEQHKKINPGVKHDKETVRLTKNRGEELMTRAKVRFAERDFAHDVNYFTLESTLCCYKGWFRENRRYANVYIDMMWDRIWDGRDKWGLEPEDVQIFVNCRNECLPDYACNQGITKEKQNHFRLTGEPIFLGNMFPDNFKKGNERCL